MFLLHCKTETVIGGEYFYCSKQLRSVFSGLLHAFILGKPLVPAHHPESRRLLCEMMLFTFDSVVRGKNNDSQRLMEHVPVPYTFETTLDLFFLIHLNIFMNALHPSTYVPLPGFTNPQHREANILTFQERTLFCASRGIALTLADWFTENYVVKWTGHNELRSRTQCQPKAEPPSNGPNRRTEGWSSLDTFVDGEGVVDFNMLWKNWIAYLAASIYGYKVVAEGRRQRGTAGCTADALKAQLRVCLELVSPTSLELFDACTENDSTWKDVDETHLLALPDWLDWLMGNTSDFHIKRRGVSHDRGAKVELNSGCDVTISLTPMSNPHTDSSSVDAPNGFARARLSYALQSHLSENKFRNFVLALGSQDAQNLTVLARTLVGTSFKLTKLELNTPGDSDSHDSGVRSLAELLEEGYELVEYEGSFPHIFQDSEGNVLLVSIPCPPPLDRAGLNQFFVEDLKQAKAFLGSTECPPNTDVGSSCVRYVCCNKNCNRLHHFPDDSTTMAMLHRSEAIKTLKTWQNTCLGSYANQLQLAVPTTACETSKLKLQYDFGPGSSPSAFAATGLRAITAGGEYDYEAGGHFVVKEAKLVLQFPPCATILTTQSAITTTQLPVQAHEYKITLASCGYGL
ncbi:hypothetical protein MD484_g7662, partial [Candolleomyces efflorescens]